MGGRLRRRAVEKESMADFFKSWQASIWRWCCAAGIKSPATLAVESVLGGIRPVTWVAEFPWHK